MSSCLSWNNQIRKLRQARSQPVDDFAPLLSNATRLSIYHVQYALGIQMELVNQEIIGRLDKNFVSLHDFHRKIFQVRGNNDVCILLNRGGNDMLIAWIRNLGDCEQ